MNEEEYEKLAHTEKKHWFYRGKRDITLFWVRKLLSGKKKIKHLDVGSGAGVLVEAMSPFADSFGVELSKIPLQLYICSDDCLLDAVRLKHIAPPWG